MCVHMKFWALMHFNLGFVVLSFGMRVEPVCGGTHLCSIQIGSPKQYRRLSIKGNIHACHRAGDSRGGLRGRGFWESVLLGNR